MKSLSRTTLIALGLTVSALASTLAKRGMTCTELLIPVTINATNVAPPPAAGGTQSTVQIHGTYNIGARYCEPTSTARSTTLQVLVHGITYTRDYWSGAGPPGQGYQGDKYSWIAYAGANAYPTLSIDRLGNGLSSHPDPFQDVQVNSEVETIHQLILKARAGTLLPNGRKFKKLIYIGHSFGSILGNRLNSLYPADVDAAILTGWTPLISQLLGGLLIPALSVAADVAPARFGNLDPNYYMINSSATALQLFYYPGNFDAALFNFDYSTRGTVSYGEPFLAAGVSGAGVLAAAFKGPVLLLSGENDKCFCPLDALGQFNCGSGGWSPVLKNTAKGLYPASSCFDAYSLPNVGHCWQYHYRAQLGFAVAHIWLKARGF